MKEKDRQEIETMIRELNNLLFNQQQEIAEILGRILDKTKPKVDIEKY